MNQPAKPRRRLAVLALLGILIAAFCLAPLWFPLLRPRLLRRATVADRLTQYGPVARARWQPYFARTGMTYPPQKLLLVGFKQEKQLSVYAASANQPLRLLRTFPILALSGKAGPKQRYGDYQVPEGFYRIESLNPNSAYHLALRINYPSPFDRAQAQKDGRTNLGGDIMIHGSNVSIGCLAIGDPAAEDLFVLAAEVGIENIRVLLAPTDLRTHTLPPNPTRPAWTTALYAQLKTQLRTLPSPQTVQTTTNDPASTLLTGR